MDVSKRDYMYESCTSDESQRASEGEEGLPRLWLVLSSVQDPMNMGGIIRTAYYLGTDKIVTHKSCKLSPVVSKASAGAMEIFDIFATKDLYMFIHEQKEQGKHIFGSVGETVTSPDSVDTNTVIEPTQLNGTRLTRDSLLLIGKFIFQTDRVLPRTHLFVERLVLTSIILSLAKFP